MTNIVEKIICVEKFETPPSMKTIMKNKIKPKIRKQLENRGRKNIIISCNCHHKRNRNFGNNFKYFVNFSVTLLVYTQQNIFFSCQNLKTCSVIFNFEIVNEQNDYSKHNTNNPLVYRISIS